MSQGKICTTINELQTDTALAEMRRVSQISDLIEIRADMIKDLNIPRLLKEKIRPVIFTCRPKRLQGGFEGDEEDRINYLIAAAAQGADYIDVEADADFMRVIENKRDAKIVISYHDFTKTPDSLTEIYRQLLSTPADIVKVATYANTLEDSFKMINLLEGRGAEEKPLIALTMGQKGIVTRLLGPSYGSFLTYAASASNKQLAAGQPTLEELTKVYRIRSTNPETKLIGLLGNPLDHSLSPAIHNAAFAALKLNLIYLPLEADNLNTFFAFATKLNLAGFSITHPYKVQVMSMLEELEDDTAAIGAVNTVCIRNLKMKGYNTDHVGFIRPLEKRIKIAGKRALIVGAGGAARAVVYALTERRARVIIANRTAEKANRLAREFKAEATSLSEIETVDCDIIVNTTSVGMYPQVNESLIPKRCLNNKLVYDLVYNPIKTKLLRDAEACGCQTISGIEMFIEQATAQFKIWTGREAPVETMKVAALERLS